MIPRIIHQTAKSLTPEESRLIRRLRSVLSDWEYRLWSDEANDALVAEYFPQFLSAFRSISLGVVRADIARYMYLSVFGGFYFDTDYKVLRPIGNDLLAHSCVLPISRSGNNSFRLGNAVMGSEPNHPIWSDFLESLFSRRGVSGLDEGDVEKTTGPEGLTDFYLDRRDRYSGVYLPDREVFHPKVSYSGLRFQRDRTTIGAHLCWGSWRKKGLVGMVRTLAVRKLTSCW